MGAATFLRAPTNNVSVNPSAPTAPFNNMPEGTLNQYAYVSGALQLSTSYATGGDTLAVPGVHGLKQVVGLLVIGLDSGLANNTSGYSVSLAGTPTAPLIKVYATAGTQVANATNLSATFVPVTLVGFR
jgi:hypothetical protein